MSEKSSPADEKSPDEWKELAYYFHVRGHALRWIAKRCRVSHQTIANWIAAAPVDKIRRIQAEAQPEIDDDVRMAREELRGQLDDPELPPWERRSAAGILLTNHTRMIDSMARKTDAETNKRLLPEQVKDMERRAKERLLGKPSSD